MNERDRKKHTATSRLDTSSLPRGPLNWVFFPAALLYHELLLRAFDRQSTFFTGTLVLVVLFALGAGLFWSLLINLFRHRQAATIVSIAATALWTVLVCVEYCCRSYFKSYFALSFIGNMASDVVGGFGDTVLPDVVRPPCLILLAFVPLALCILLRRRIVTEQRMGPLVPAVPAGRMSAVRRHRQRSGPLGHLSRCLYLQLHHRYRCDPLRAQRQCPSGDHLRHFRAPQPPAARAQTRRQMCRMTPLLSQRRWSTAKIP